ncbi:hypothetical protein N7468_006033 [Penicillium chermesinum]|uniref:Uncharacterized protein n=1 Tax=Penicillium chermesinum TaxID=63820 RepID=A0A9W9TNT0_9EURO|nr:uncharacterized protein N7468_006033 [Penicillium chermesinum]KAJ5233077.1 hypothetical protein N7468_006033 [Penicillium chermesinum]
MTDLFSSRWAPGAGDPPASYTQSSKKPRRARSENRLQTATATPPAPTPGNQRTHSPARFPPSEELARFLKIVSRLKWKLPFLAEGYRLATLVVGENGVSAEEVAHAEIMFKIDFFEYYALLERAIVHLLSVFNISVSGMAHPYNNGGYLQRTAGQHRFHANVLQALEEESSPLTPVLGTAPVIEYLKKAKELRNRWKTADMTKIERQRDYERDQVLPLASYNFEEILAGIFAGLEEAYIRAKTHVDLCKRPGDEKAEDKMASDSDWDFMVDAMDWEAV